jgi:hypothetical protein
MTEAIVQIGQTVRYALTGNARTVRLSMILILVVVLYVWIVRN